MSRYLRCTTKSFIHTISLLRFYELTERMSKMEASIAPIVTKLDSILGRIEDAKRIKMQKKVAMQSFISNIEDDDQRES